MADHPFEIILQDFPIIVDLDIDEDQFEVVPWYLIFRQGISGAGDTVKPVIGNFSPALLTQVPKNQILKFDVTDDSGLFRRIIVVVNFSTTGVEEVVHDGDEFRGAFNGKSSRSAIPNGFRYCIARGAGGWLGNPNFRTFAIDQSGNEAL